MKRMSVIDLQSFSHLYVINCISVSASSIWNSLLCYSCVFFFVCAVGSLFLRI